MQHDAPDEVLRDWAGFDNVMDRAAMAVGGRQGEMINAIVHPGGMDNALPPSEVAELFKTSESLLADTTLDLSEHPWMLPVTVAIVFGGLMLLLAACLPSGWGDAGARQEAMPPPQPDRDARAAQSPPATSVPAAPDRQPAPLPSSWTCADADSTDESLEHTGECVICLEQIQRSAIGSCPHKFCAACLLECCRLTPRCPRCQTTVKAIWLDTEFDTALRLARAGQAAELESRDEAAARLAPYVKWLRIPKGGCVGITLKNCLGRPGVVVAKLTERDQAYQCGVREGDVIVSINNTPCRSHKQVIAFINKLTERATGTGDVQAMLLVIPQVGLNSPVVVTAEPWEADAGEADWEAEHGRRAADAADVGPQPGEGAEWDCVMQ